MRQLIDYIEAKPARSSDRWTRWPPRSDQPSIWPVPSRGCRAVASQYVLMRRIERAKELLRNTDMPLVDVALSVGFSSQVHLSHWMHRHTGVSPAAYRRPARERRPFR